MRQPSGPRSFADGLEVDVFERRAANLDAIHLPTAGDELSDSTSSNACQVPRP